MHLGRHRRLQPRLRWRRPPTSAREVRVDTTEPATMQETRTRARPQSFRISTSRCCPTTARRPRRGDEGGCGYWCQLGPSTGPAGSATGLRRRSCTWATRSAEARERARGRRVSLSAALRQITSIKPACARSARPIVDQVVAAGAARTGMPLGASAAAGSAGRSTPPKAARDSGHRRDAAGRPAGGPVASRRRREGPHEVEASRLPRPAHRAGRCRIRRAKHDRGRRTPSRRSPRPTVMPPVVKVEGNRDNSSSSVWGVENVPIAPFRRRHADRGASLSELVASEGHQRADLPMR